jgi:dUTP pyrophosphatase
MKSNKILSNGSHKIINFTCEFQISKKCQKIHPLAYRDGIQNKKRNSGKYICFYCSRELKYAGRKNPNCHYKNTDDNFFKNIDTEEKAYLLGWIISDGSVQKRGFQIFINKKDTEILKKLRDIISPEIPTKTKKRKPNNLIGFVVNSQEIATDLSNLLQIPFVGGKDSIVSMPDNLNDKLKWACIRGVFDGDGSINNPINSQKHHCGASIATTSSKLRKQIKEFVKIPCYENVNGLSWSCNNALDFLGKIYEHSKIYLERKYDLYSMWCSYVPALRGKNYSVNYEKIKFLKTVKEATLPKKERISDSGYDLTIIKKIKEIGDVEFYTTGIKVQFDSFGWYGMVVPRSSLSKTGYMMANSIGIIDRSYLGEILIALRKIDKTANSIILPARIAQLIPMPIVHFEIKEVTEFQETDRNEKGFGSTGDK